MSWFSSRTADGILRRWDESTGLCCSWALAAVFVHASMLVSW